MNPINASQHTERIVNPDQEEKEEEKKIERTLRPKTLEGFIGQQHIKEPLDIAMQAAEKRKEPIEHVLLYGNPGRGKTTLAHIIAKEMDAVIVIGGRSSSNTKQLWKIAKDQNPNTIWIEDPSEVKSDENKEFLRRAKSIGIISGASTSPDDINMVRKMIESSD